MDRVPISPPLKKSGLTTNESVVNTILLAGMLTMAPSLRDDGPVSPRISQKTVLTSSLVNLPPLPWPRRITLSIYYPYDAFMVLLITIQIGSVACSFTAYHTRSYRCWWSAYGSKRIAVFRSFFASQNCTADTSFCFFACYRYVESFFGVKLGNCFS